MASLAGVTPTRDVFLEVIMSQLSGDFLRNNPLYERGAVAATHKALLAVLQTRGLRVTEGQRARIEATDDEATLDAWMRAAVTAATTGEVLRHAPGVTSHARKKR